MSAAPGRKAGSGAGAGAGAEAASEAADAAGDDGDGRDRKKAGAPEGDARLKAAVAAWVAESDAPDDEANSGSEKPGVPEPRSASDKDKPGVPEARSASDAEKPADRAATAAGAKPESDGKKPADKADKPADKADKPAADEKSASGDDKPAERAAAGDKPQAERKKPTDRATAVFGAVKPQAEAEKPAGKGEAKAEPETGGKKPTDQATAVFGAVKPAGDKPKAEAEKPTGKGEAKKPTDQATAVFRTVKPAAGEKSADEAKAKAKPTDQATAAFGTVKPAPKADAPKGADQPTELLKAPPVPPAGKPASQFVPLKKDDAPKAAPKAAPKPAAKPAAAKPAVPVSVPPPVAPAPQAPGAPQEPKAPLDLLAQLTNTPPPAPTPARTVARRLKIWTPLVVLLAIIFVVVQAFRPLPDPKLALGAKKAYTFEGGNASFVWPDEGQSAVKVVGAGDVGTFGGQKPVPTASVAKVMTAYVILKNHPLKEGDKTSNMVKIDEQSEKEAGAQDESRVPVRTGQEFSEYDMLRMLLIPSGNNIARQLARWDSQSEDAFVKKMNDTAKDLGMTNTTYTDPSGLTPTTVSTAVDQVKLAEEVIKNPVIRDITQQPNADIPGLSPSRINNNNDTLLVKHTGVLGIKTGSSTQAGGTLMWAGRKKIDNKEYLIVGATMDQHFKGGPDPNAENSLTKVKNKSYEQLTAVQQALRTATVIKKGDVVGYVDDGLDGKTPVVATKDVVAVGWAGFATKFALETDGKKIPHTAKAGTEVGELVVGSGASAVKVPVALQKQLAEPSFGAKLTRLG
ncbi:D-alanyl-D-alanine carboxypeptidase [Streptomyces olivoverticillatus]|uniref:D-alanyl-D-alanine carboxypeptidase n=1 Tax=Streptomyces olivoverticillatus TaxID=66427 RepID=A0A7W7PNB4_9ACTN|nr:D-alanyl-D-alanine carboxypeptidase [Streptomyces olivoverticillatus]MBB4894665.1 D-alanyl-D-alanine carboxypeptidase [Streptomyces olivoverticillatus]